MFLWTFIGRLIAQRQLEGLAQRISLRSYGSVWERVHARAVVMSHAEARGYIRAHARGVVQAETTVVVESRPVLRGKLEERLIDCAVERLVDQIYNQLRQVRLRQLEYRAAA